jgi:filamentous hemagglutinin family protein
MRTTKHASISNHLISSTSLARPALLALLAAGAVVAPAPAFALDDGALPTGESVVGGSATFDRGTVNVLNINQSTDRLVVNWSSFSIGKSATTEFFQPNSGSLAVNRVVAGKADPTQILGTLKANGRVMVLDPNGVLFGAGSVIDVGGIVASTGSIDTDAVMSGAAKLVLTNLGETGSVVNEGLVKVADGGLAAFVAPTVRNSGVISAKLGKVVLAAGTETATVDLYGDGLVELAVSKNGAKVLSENTGVIDAESGTVLMTASAAKDVVDTVVNMSGVVNASSATMKGGKIILSAGGGKAKVSGKLGASGTSGGAIAVTGKNVHITDTAELKANAGENGNGGEAYIYGDDYAIFEGYLEAMGGSVSGNGGNAEISAGESVGFNGLVDLSAANGSNGTLTIDPTHLFINDTFSLLGFTFSPGDTVTVYDQALANTLRTANVNLWATNDISTGSDIDISTWERLVSCGFFCLTVQKGITTNNLTLAAPTVNLAHDVILGTGKLNVNDLPAGSSVLGFGLINPPHAINVDTLNIDGIVFTRSAVGGATSVAGDAQINTTADTINIQSPNAKIQQGVSFANNGANINVAAGTYNESVLVNKSVGLYGTNAVVSPNSPGFDVVADNVTIDGFEIVGADDGIRVTSADNVTLTDNYIHDLASGTGILVESSDFTEIAGNTIQGGLYGIRVDEGQGANIHHNAVSNTGDDGIDVHTNSGVDIRYNNISGAGDNGIEVSHSDNADIDHNTVNGAAGYGVKLTYSDHVAVTDNDLYGTMTGIWASRNSNLWIDGNDIDHNLPVNEPAGGNVGIHVDSSHNVQIGDGVFSGNNGNYIDDFAIGIEVSGNTGYTTIDGNDISDVNNGIVVSSTAGLGIYDNDINGRTQGGRGFGDGIRVTSSDWARIGGVNDGNTVHNFTGNGVGLINSDHVYIGQNAVYDVSGNGIFVDPSDYVEIAFNDVHNVGSDGVHLDDGAYGNIHHNTVQHVGGDGVDVNDNYDADIHHNTVYNTGDNGIEVSGSLGTDIYANDIDEVDGDGIHVSASDWADIYDNDINVNRFGANTLSDGIEVENSDDVEIYRNNIDDTANVGIDLYNTDDVRVFDNLITDAHTGIRLNDSRISGALVDNNVIRNVEYGVWADDVRGLIVTDNNIDGRYMESGDGAIGIYVDGSYDALIGGWHDGNIVEDFDTGIRIVNSGSADVEYNDVSEFDDYGVWISSSDYVDVKNNDVYDGDGTGVRVYGSDWAEINDNDIDHVRGHGIELVDSDHVDILRNDVNHTGQHGIFVDPSDYVEIAFNTVHDADWDGIHVDDGHNASVYSNHVGRSGNDGIDINNNDGVSVRSNYVHDSRDNGIEVSDSWDADIRYNTVGNSRGDGIEVTNSAFADVRNNEVRDSGDDGIDVDGSYMVDVNDNHVHGARNNGIEVTNSYDADIDGNRVHYTGEDGIYVENSDYADITDNEVHDTGDDGIDVRGGRGVDVTSNNIWRTAGDGVQSRWSDFIDVLWNKVSFANDDGIDVEGGEGVDVKGNKVSSSRNNGIEVTDARGVDVSWNWVNGSGDDGVHVEGGNDVLISHNIVWDSGHDGISVSDVYGYGGPAVGISAKGGPVYSFYNAKIIGNWVTDSGNHGIAAYEVPRILIGWNVVKDSGFSGHNSFRGEGPSCSRGGDGIHVEVSDGGRKGSGDVLVDIIGNAVAHSSDDGIDVNFTHYGRKNHGGHGGNETPTLLMSEGYDEYDEGPYVQNTVDINILGNGVYDSRDDGIVVTLHGDRKEGDHGQSEMNGFMESGRGGGHGHGITEITVNVKGNFVSNPVDDYKPAKMARTLEEGNGHNGWSRGDGIQVDSYFSPWANVVTDTTVSRNFVSNSGENGIYISGPSHDFVTTAGNILTNNPVGMHFESGEIDLTGDANTIIGGDVGLLFRPYIVGFEHNDYPEVSVKTAYPPMTGDPIYAPMSLVDNTIGTTIFEGQSTYYIELDNGAFFDPGRPTLLNGLDATYDGFNPASHGGILTQAQYNHLESMIYHYRDDRTLGLFFFGVVPQLGNINQEDILRLFGGFNPNSPSGGLIITGLPRIGGGGGAPGAGGVAGFLAGLAPAAGDEEDNGEGESVANIEPAAGDVNDAACWGDATNMLGQGTPVSYSFGDEATGLLDKAESCGQSF